MSSISTSNINAEHEKNLQIVGALSSGYTNIYLVHRSTKVLEIVKLDGYVTAGLDKDKSIEYPYSATVEAYISARVFEEDVPAVREFMDWDNVTADLDANGDHQLVYRINEHGEVHYYEGRYRNLADPDLFICGFQCVDETIEAEKARAEQELALRKAMEQHLESITALNRELQDQNDIVANAGLGMWHIILKDGCEPRMKPNAKMLEILGIPGRTDLTEEEVYSWWWDHITPDAIPSVNASVAEMLDGKFSENTYLWEHPTKGLIYTRCGGTCVTQPDGTHVVSGYHGDVTDIVLEDQRQKAALAEARDAANAANEAKTSFLFNMSHDIRTPMNAIIGFTGLLRKYQEDPVRREDYLDKIEDSSNVLLSIINNVLEMARIERGTVEVNDEVCQTGSVGVSLKQTYEPLMREKGVDFSCSVDVEHSYVYNDPVKTREILDNLLSNALKYTEPGDSVRLMLEELPCDRPGWGLFRSTVADTGIGMSEEFLPHLFEEFAREHTSTETKVQGTGLGMPIVKRLVDVLDGTIEVTSKQGEGTTFVLELPHRIAENPCTEKEEVTEVDPAQFLGKRILLAEDNDLNAEIAEEILGDSGFVVDRAEDGAVCLQMLQSVPAGTYDVILMDIQMPHMDGYDATRAIRDLDNLEKANIPILAMTANAFEEDRRKALRIGMDGHLAKPINVPELLRALANVLS